jgi:hypothetical protein
MPSGAIAGSACVLKRGNGATPTEVFTTIAEVKGVRGPGLVGATTEVTSFDSANDVREFIATLRDPGTISCTVNYLPANSTHTGLITDLRDGVRRNFQLVIGDTSPVTMAFTGIVTGFEITSELEQAIQANVSVKLTGWPTWS